MFSSQLPKRNSVSIFPASRSTTRTRRACGSVSSRTSCRESVESVESPRRFVACSAKQYRRHAKVTFRPPAGSRGGIDNFNAATQARKIGLPYQQRNWRPPIGTLLHLRAARSTIRGNVKPNVSAVDEEKLLLRRFVIPAHSPRSRKVDSARFRLNSAFAIGIALEEGGFESVNAGDNATPARAGSFASGAYAGT